MFAIFFKEQCSVREIMPLILTVLNVIIKLKVVRILHQLITKEKKTYIYIYKFMCIRSEIPVKLNIASNNIRIRVRYINSIIPK